MKNRKKIELEETAGEKEMRLSWKADAWNGRSTPEIAAHSGALGVVGGSLPVSSAEALASNWEDRAKGLQLQAAAASSDELKGRLACASDVFWLCARQLRRQMESATERQPEENNKGQPRPTESL